jgi:hypothetical protein
MTTSVTIKNNGPHRVNVNEVEPVSPIIKGNERTVNSHTLGMGHEITLNLWGIHRYICIIETDDTDTSAEVLATSSKSTEA